MKVKRDSRGYIILLTQEDMTKLIRWYEFGESGLLFFRTKNHESVIFGEEVTR